MTNKEKAKNYFLENDERCRIWEERGIRWVMHHKDPSWRHNDVERYAQWNIDDLLPMTISAHMFIHSIGKNNHNYGVHRYGKDAPHYGHRHSEETKKKMHDAKEGKHRTLSDEARKKMSVSHTGKHGVNLGRHWYNNGTKNIMAFDCPEGFVLGKLK